ncbi:hypothetical protein Pmani_023004 [Petrolisthes manimaculis]|uniref:RNA helicase n=1 Tax=Petrolisthes manimaculis TaxID=1843537 RepID=A0AAE1PAJ6_9EUCA|nr:hypothetical protein Pmani_023004 [Petrolisthes manimaculis]
MGGLGVSWVLGGRPKTWHHLQLCQVEDAGTMWVREGPSDEPSKERMAFLQLEKQFNAHFRKVYPPHHLFVLPRQTGDCVAVEHQKRWYRGLVESVTMSDNGDRQPRVKAFLLDYGNTIVTTSSSIVDMRTGQWCSVPYQAKRISLFGIIPVSLKYVVTAANFKLIPRESREWDSSATKFVREIYHLKPQAEFQPISLGPDGCLQGFLSVALPEHFLANTPHLGLERHLKGEHEDENVLKLDLSGILVLSGYGAWDNTVMVELLKRAEDDGSDGSIREVMQRMEGRCGGIGLNGSDQQELMDRYNRESTVNVGKAGVGDGECNDEDGNNSDGLTSTESLESLPSPARCRMLLRLPIKHSTPLGSVTSSLPSFSSLPSSSTSSSGSANSSVVGSPTRPSLDQCCELMTDQCSEPPTSTTNLNTTTERPASSSPVLNTPFTIEEIPSPVLKSELLICRGLNILLNADKGHGAKTIDESKQTINDGKQFHKHAYDALYTRKDVTESRSFSAAESCSKIKEHNSTSSEQQNSTVVEKRNPTSSLEIPPQESPFSSMTTSSNIPSISMVPSMQQFHKTKVRPSAISFPEQNLPTQYSPNGNRHCISHEREDAPQKTLCDSYSPSLDRKHDSYCGASPSDVIENKVGMSEHHRQVFGRNNTHGNKNMSAVHQFHVGNKSLEARVGCDSSVMQRMENDCVIASPANPSQFSLPPWLSKSLLATLRRNTEYAQIKECDASTRVKSKPLISSHLLSVDSNKKQGMTSLVTQTNKTLLTGEGSVIEGTKDCDSDVTVEDNSKAKPTLTNFKTLHGSCQSLNLSFMSDTRNVWTPGETEEDKQGYIRELEEEEFAPIMNQHNNEVLNLVQLYRVYVGGESPLAEEEVMVNENITSAQLNPHIIDSLEKLEMRATRLQAFTWPALARGSSAVIIGGNSCGKTQGYVVPLISTILDTWQHTNKRLVAGVGAVLVVICGSWRGAKCVADYIVNFLPNTISLRIVTAWGGCGLDEMENTKKLLLGGCDILITTAPCLARLLTGEEAVCKTSSLPDEPKTPITSLSRCCHLVLDDADITLQQFPSEVKQIMKTWGNDRSKGNRGDMEQQMVVVGSHWTPLLDSLTHMLLPIMDPTVIISAPLEAAIAAKVTTQAHFVNSESDSMSKVVALIRSSFVNKRNLVFVSDTSVANNLATQLKSATVYCLVISDSIIWWELQNFVREWHMVRGITLVVCRTAEHLILGHDIANADAIFHTHIPSHLSRFALRYALMINNMSTDLNKKSQNCESHVMVSKETFIALPTIMEELQRICDHLPEEVITAGALRAYENNLKHNTLCYYLKAYGKCPVQLTCGFRHKIQPCDIPTGLPRTGEVSFEVVRVLNASRFLVRLTEFREEAGSRSVNLKTHYTTLFLTLQQHFGDPARREPLTHVAQGTMCAVKDSEGRWSRGQVVKVSYAMKEPLLAVFLIDEGRDTIITLKSAYTLPPHLAAVPELIVEVYLCRVRPIDQDHEWTLLASRYMHDTFLTEKTSTFVGRITLALGLTLWLSPIIEFTKVSKTYLQKGSSLRGRLITQGFGMDNPSHIEHLEELCKQTSLLLDQETLRKHTWKSVLDRALKGLNSYEVEELSESNSSNSTLRDEDTIAGVNFVEQNHKVKPKFEEEIAPAKPTTCLEKPIAVEATASSEGESSSKSKHAQNVDIQDSTVMVLENNDNSISSDDTSTKESPQNPNGTVINCTPAARSGSTILLDKNCITKSHLDSKNTALNCNPTGRNRNMTSIKNRSFRSVTVSPQDPNSVLKITTTTSDRSVTGQDKNRSKRQCASPSILWEKLPLNTDIRVMIVKVESPERFFVIREDRLLELKSLETEIETLAEYLQTENLTCLQHHLPSLQPPSPCLARFTDNKYCRGMILEGDSIEERKVYFLDRGEVLHLPHRQVHACPNLLVGRLCGQAIMCRLAHITLSDGQVQEATEVMAKLADSEALWIARALELRETSGSWLEYTVELTSTCQHPRQMKELVEAGVTLTKEEEEGYTDFDISSLPPVVLDKSFIDGKEATDFLMNFPELRAQIEQLQITRNPLKEEMQKKGNPSEGPLTITSSVNTTSDSTSEIPVVQACRGHSPHLQCASKNRVDSCVPCSVLTVSDSVMDERAISEVERQNSNDTQIKRNVSITEIKEISHQRSGRKHSISLTDSAAQPVNNIVRENPSKGSDTQSINNNNENKNNHNTQSRISYSPTSLVNSDTHSSRHFAISSVSKIAHPTTSNSRVNTTQPTRHFVSSVLNTIAHPGTSTNATHPARQFVMSTVDFQNACLLVPPLEAVESVTPRLNPEVSWKQSETDVTITLHLLGVQVYRCRVAPQRFTFMTMLRDKFYAVDETLAGSVDADHSFTRVRGTCITITLRKDRPGEWKSLLGKGERRAWLRAEYQPSTTDEEDSQQEVLWKNEGPTTWVSDTDESSAEFSEDDLVS